MSSPRRVVSRRRSRQARGASAVEFALVFTLVVLPLIFGIIQYGYHYWSLETAAAAAREAARAAAVGTDWDCTSDRAAAIASRPAVGDDAPVVTRSYDTPDGQPRVGALVTVTVTFDSLDVGFLPVPDDGRITESSRARVEVLRPDQPLPCAE